MTTCRTLDLVITRVYVIEQIYITPNDNVL